MASATYVWILMVLTSVTSGRAGCLQTNGVTDPVVLMCKDGYAHGTSVYIDTSAASGTDNEPGPVCTCSVEIKKADFVNITTQNSREVCGSRLIYNIGSTNETFNDTGSCKEASFRKSVSQKDSLIIVLEKIETPFDADYCIHLKTETCGKDQFHCVKAGICISESHHCDGLPGDCGDGSGEDEDNCGIMNCSEGQLLCASRDQCYSDDKRCDNVTDCTDGSDEINCGSSGVTTTLAPETDPVIYVNCTESTRFTTTTTPTTTTTTPSTTTTTPTTTTIPTTTTTETTTTITTSTPTTTTSTSTTTTPITTTRKTTTTESHTTSPGENGEIIPDDNMKPNVIAGIVVGSILPVLIIVVVIACLIRRNKRVREYLVERRKSKYKENEERDISLKNLQTHK